MLPTDPTGDAAAVHALVRDTHTFVDTLYLLGPDAAEPVPVPVSPGSQVIADAGTSPRWSATLYVPFAAFDGMGAEHYPVTPFGTACAVRRTYQLPDLSGPVYVWVFSGMVTEVESQYPEGRVQISAEGWERGVAEDLFTVSSQIKVTDRTYTDEIVRLIERTYPTVTVELDGAVDDTATLEKGYSYAPGDDPMSHILEHAQSVQAEVFCRPTDSLDRGGIWVIRPVPRTGDYVADVNVVTPSTIMVRARSTVRRSVNRVRVRFEPNKPTSSKPARTGAATVVSGAQDPDVMGRVTEFQRRTGYRTSTQANAVATRVLTQRNRRAEQITWDQVPAAYLEPGDTVPVDITGSGETVNRIINRLYLPLEPGTDQQIAARETAYTEP